MSTPEQSVLVVDDEEGIARLCQRVLGKAGYQTQMVTDPYKGMDLVQHQPFDLLLLDIRMPEMDGFQFMTRARVHQPDLAVVIMTGFGTVETAIEALRQGADGLILKPFEDTGELVRSVEEALKASRSKREIARLMALRPLFNLTESLFSETDPDRLIDLILTAVCGHLRCEHAGFYRSDEVGERLELVAGLGSPLPALDDGGDNPVGRAHLDGSILAIYADGSGDTEMQSFVARHGLGSVLCAPVAREAQFSVLSAGRSTGEPNFSEADIEMFGIMARQAAVALENARLYGELRDYVRQVEESQQALIQAEKMAAVGRLTASIAHEINNPLQALGNCLHLAGRMDLEPAQREEYLALAESELKRLMSTVQRMLDFYRLSSTERDEADVNQLIERVLKLLRKQLDEQSVSVQMDLVEGLPKVQVVTNQIQQVFFNILLNAMDAMPGGGQIHIRTHAEDGVIEVYFEDTGPGVAEEVRERIFEPFLSTREHGTGLGLSVSYNILDAHGGSLVLVPDRDRGACFRVQIPIGE